MSLINALQSGSYSYVQGSQSNITITTGDGNNNINVTGGNLALTTGNGNQNISANIANTLSITTGLSGQDVVNASALSAVINTNDSDDVIKFTGENFNISAIGGNNTILVNGGLDSTNANSITVGDGNDVIVAKGNNLNVQDSSGDLTGFLYSNNMDIASGDGTHNIGFWGNNVNINLGDGANNIQTLDYTIAGANANTIATLNSAGIVNELQDQTKVSSVVTSRTILQNSSFNSVDTIIKQYGLNATEAASLKQLYASGQINENYSDGTPKYVLMASPDLTRQNGGNPVYVIGVRDGSTHTWSLNNYRNTVRNATSNYSGDGKECIALDSDTNWATGTVTGQSGVIYQDNVTTTYLLNGVSDLNISTGDGQNNIFVTGDSSGKSNIAINVGDGNNNIGIRNGFYTSATEQGQIVNKMTTDSANVLVGTKTHTSPLIVDYDQDGKVEATAAMGVDVDNNGVADGAATGGDKMLAMSDFGGNGHIDGSEVFGDQTVSPFTGQKINAANGFDALKTIAEQAKQYTGIDCMKNGSVDLQSLKQALSTVGVNLGFVSDANDTNLEDLGHVASINVDNYATQDDDSDVAHKQLGSYTSTDGTTHEVDDVWFKAQQIDKNFFAKAINID